MSFYVKSDGVVHCQANTPMPAPCPECPAYIPLFNWMNKTTILKCWNCNFAGPLDLFMGDVAYEFTPERIQ